MHVWSSIGLGERDVRECSGVVVMSTRRVQSIVRYRTYLLNDPCSDIDGSFISARAYSLSFPVLLVNPRTS